MCGEGPGFHRSRPNAQDATKFRSPDLPLAQEATSSWFPGQHRCAHQQRQRVGPDAITGCSPITALVAHGNGRIDGSPRLAQSADFRSCREERCSPTA
jgi:hypothetical protein